MPFTVTAPTSGAARKQLFASTAPNDCIAQFYEDDARLSELVAEYWAPGWDARQSLLVIMTAEHRAGFERELHLRGGELEPLVRSGQLVLLDARETLGRVLVDGQPDREIFREVIDAALARALAFRPNAELVRVYDEMEDLLWQEGLAVAARTLGDLWRERAQERRFSILHPYPVRSFARPEDSVHFDALCHHHSHVFPDETLVESGDLFDHLRQVCLLQQRGRALETERVARKGALSSEEFLAMLGHELRNPLSPILTTLKLMQLRQGNEGARERELIERQVTHLVRLVDDLLNVSRITQGKVQLRREPLELAQVVSAAVEQAGPALEERRHVLEVDVARTGLRVDGDQQRLVQVISNLLLNAARFTDPEGRVEVRGWRDEETVVVSVRDTGIGISEELLSRVFDLFVQGPRSLDRAQGGLGLGLPMVRSLLQLHDGTVTATSEGPGKGSTFTVRLPLSASSARRELSVAPPPPPLSPTRGRRILVVDDNEDAASVLAETLSFIGYATEVAFDGPQTLALASEFQPELVLLDIGLPGMDGYEVARRLRAVPGLEEVPLIAVTGYGQESDRALALRSGFVDHLVKPVSFERLQECITALLKTDDEVPSTG